MRVEPQNNPALIDLKENNKSEALKTINNSFSERTIRSTLSSGNFELNGYVFNKTRVSKLYR